MLSHRKYSRLKMKIKITKTLSLVVLSTAIVLTGCNNSTDTSGNNGSATEQGKQVSNTPDSSKQQSETSVIEVQKTQISLPEKKEFLDENSYKKLDSVNQYNVLYFKFNKDELKKPENMIYWIGLNNCEIASASKINNEFEWPAILEKYTNSIDSVLDKMPTTTNIMLVGWLGQYDMKEKSFPVINSYGSNEQYSIGKIDIGDSYQGVACNNANSNDIRMQYAIDFAQEIKIPKIIMDEATAKDYVTRYPEPISRKVVVSIDLDVVGTNKVGNSSIEFKANPKKITILEEHDRNKVIHEYDFQVVK